MDKKDAANRTELITSYFRPRERALIEEMAHRQRLSVSAFVRDAVLERAVNLVNQQEGETP